MPHKSANFCSTSNQSRHSLLSSFTTHYSSHILLFSSIYISHSFSTFRCCSGWMNTPQGWWTCCWLAFPFFAWLLIRLTEYGKFLQPGRSGKFERFQYKKRVNLLSIHHSFPTISWNWRLWEREVKWSVTKWLRINRTWRFSS